MTHRVGSVALLTPRLEVSHVGVGLREYSEEEREHDEDGDEEVDEQQHCVEVAGGVVHDVVDVGVEEEGAREGDEGGDLVDDCEREVPTQTREQVEA